MTTYAINEAEMLLPAGWIDSSITTISVHPRNGNCKVDVLVFRLPTERQSLAEAVDELISDQRRKLPQFALLHNLVCELDGRSSHDIAVRFATQERRVYQRALATLSHNTLLLTACVGEAGCEASVDEVTAKVMSTLRWRDRGGLEQAE